MASVARTSDQPWSHSVAAAILAKVLHPVRRLITPSLVALVGLGLGELAATAQVADRSVDELIERMSPTERVGQLFVVPFYGSDVEDGTEIARLLDEYSVGGVVLDPSRGNFTNGPEAPYLVARLTNDLQTRAASSDGPFVPMFIAATAGGDSYPDVTIWGGLTPLPSQLALGAGWDPDLAERTGEILGREFKALGVNLLLGPSLDVLNVPRPATSGDLGVRSFGGSPPWVALFGKRYIQGVHRGSGGRVAVAPGNFPGIGGADRSQAEELPVVESTLQQLTELELAPFTAVAEGISGAESVADAFVTSHVRYRGVQQQTDRPLSLDSGGLRYLWAQIPALGQWRHDGDGVLVSAGLGLPAVRRYVEPDASTFNSRRVIREALAAGNDVLTLTGLAEDPGRESEMAEVEAVIQWLAVEYEEDEAVREMVDESLRRVLLLKRRLYPSGALAAVLVDAESAAAATGLGGEDVAAVARNALTLITPQGAVSGVAGSLSPQAGDRILFVVDAREGSECVGCDPHLTLSPNQILDKVRRAYGPSGTGRVQYDGDVAAITFAELKAWLQAQGRVAAEDTPTVAAPVSDERLSEISTLLQTADWLVFLMLDLRPAESPGSDALKLFLRAAPPEAADGRLVAVALGAPFYLDTTEIAGLDAYYAVYSRAPQFMDVAVRALFGDEAATGASPVSIPGAGYDLDQQLEPALDQSVTLELVGQNPQVPLSMGSTFRVRTSLVHDANGNVVPDGTNVVFRRYDKIEDVFLPDVPAQTVSGRAIAPMGAERNGELAISAALDNGLAGEELVLRIEGRSDGANDGLPLPNVPLPAVVTRSNVPVDWGILMLSLGLMLLAGALVYGIDPEAARSPTRLLRLFLLSLSWGLAGYLLVAAGGLQLASLPAGNRLWPEDWNIAYQAPMVSFALATLPVIVALIRSSTRRGQVPESDAESQ